MRVAHILRKFDPREWGGTETAIDSLAGGLASNGCQSVVFAPSLAVKGSDAGAFASPGVTLRRFRAVLPVWGISAARRNQLVAVSGNVVSLDLPGALWREPTIGVIHSHALGRLGAIAQAVARGRGRPFVLTVHGGAYDVPASMREEWRKSRDDGWDWGRPLGLLLRARTLFSTADAIITCNPREAQLIRERHPDRRVVMQPHGVPAEIFARDHRAAARAAFPSIVGREVLLFPGRIDPVKNQDWLVSQTAELVRRHPKSLIVLAGPVTDRAYGDALWARIVRESLDNSIVVTGLLPSGDPRLVGLFQEARAVVLPSVSETFGLVILEAWASGTPVVSSRTSGAGALIADGKNGFLFSLDRPAEFHSAVDRILSSEPHRIAMGESGRARVRDEFDTAALAGRISRLYSELIEEKHAHRHTA